MRATPGPRIARPLVFGFVFAAQCLVLLACAYLLLGRGDLPGFFPHAFRSQVGDDERDVPMAAFLLALACGALYGAWYAKTHRSWMRSRNWHRKHGRI